jgi:hypothetical protein
MVDFSTASNEAEFIEAVRNVYKAYVPESDAWAQPNFFSINATIIGGLTWTAYNEAKNGIDLRVNPQTAQGEYLDIIAGTPPLNLTRYGPTQATGNVAVNFPAMTVVPAGYVFTTSAGVTYRVTANTALTAGVGTVPVVSNGTGTAQNSLVNQPLPSSDGMAVSLGIYGGNDTETDDQLRDRMYGERSKAHFFGSACSYEDVLKGLPGVTRAWAIEDGLTAKIVFLMEDKYPCGEPLPSDVSDIISMLQDECLTNMFFCPVLEGATSISIAPEIIWTTCPADTCEVENAMRDWLRANYNISEGVAICDIQRFLDEQFPDLGGKVACCGDYPPVPCAVYNCVELVG